VKDLRPIRRNKKNGFWGMIADVYLFQVALISARLSPIAVAHLLHSIGARSVFASPRLASLAEAAFSEGHSPDDVELHISQPFDSDFPPGTEFLNNPLSSPEHYVSESDRDVLILHSSGTTGLPKPIYQPHRYLLGFSQCYMHNKDEIVESLNMSTLPLYHGFGLVPSCLALGIGKPFYIPPANTVPTGSSTATAIRSSGAQSLMTVPHILEEICALPPEEGMDIIRPLQFVASAGGPLNHATGEKLAVAGVNILAHFGTTEIGPIAPLFKPGPDYDWRFFKLREDMDLRLEAANGYYTLMARPFGWDTDFILQDRLVTSERHPGQHFRAVGRNDDLIVLSTGEKVLPAILETFLCESPLVKAACVFGEARFELGVIVEPAILGTDAEQLKDDIWPIILEASQKMDSHAQLSSKTSIVVADCALPRSDKGSLVRREAWIAFADNIEHAYRQLEESNVAVSSMSIHTETLEQDLKDMLRTELGWTDILGHSDDFFELGMNSLQAMRICRKLRSADLDGKRLPSGAVPNDFLYKNSNMNTLVQALKNHGATSLSTTSEEDLIVQLSQQYSLRSKAQMFTVLLTGGTGSLGSHVIAALARNPAVAKIICLNRRQAADSENLDCLHIPKERQIRALQSKGINATSEVLTKLEVVEIDIREANFGLSSEQYAQLSSCVTHILHAAWPMDFQRNLSSFNSQFELLRSLLQLAIDIHNSRPIVRPRLLFISSIAVVGQYHAVNNTRIVPEVSMPDARTVNQFGYGKAKFICEKMLEAATATQGEAMEVAIVRVGQMSGSRDSGYWNSKEHFPSLVRLSQKIGALPKIRGVSPYLQVLG
jgi:acyl-CoA synthetase (AMP-forming)/AMP-acid ligase II/nucleoside-diphosphate-sugar epimerase